MIYLGGAGVFCTSDDVEDGHVRVPDRDGITAGRSVWITLVLRLIDNELVILAFDETNA